MQISFQGSFISPATIKKLNPRTNEYLPKEVSIVKLDTKDNNDLDTLADLATKWEKTFAESIFNDSNYDIDLEIYAVTKQTDNFEKLKARDILGITEAIKTDRELEIEYLQTHPKYKNDHTELFPKYKDIGRVIINALKERKDIDYIKAFALNVARPFYIKNGFEGIKEPYKPENYVAWERNA